MPTPQRQFSLAHLSMGTRLLAILVPVALIWLTIWALVHG